ncbi:MAG TPA: hypothetical protein DCQ92_05355 [Verrucomicrobia subdivision 3 bacterium]|nr:hypothetical protein [Limisphaerales bacterium]
MNPQTINRASGAGIGLLIVSVIFAVLAVAVKLFVTVPALDADRAAVLSKALAEIRASENISLNNAGWIDQSRGIVRLPIETAVQLAARAWQNPASARADLTARAEKAAAPAPKAPEKPSAFE